jgi:hypothetical protein
MNSFKQLVQHVKNANWSGANQVFSEIMQQKVADRLSTERQTIFKEETDGDTKYQEYFKSQLKKHGYDSPADIPDDKKDDFFNAVDKGYKAKNESYNLKENHDFTATELRVIRDALNHRNSGSGAWQRGGASRFRQRAEKDFYSKDLRVQASFGYYNKSGSQAITDVTVVILAHFDTESKGSARIVVYSPENREGKVFSYANAIAAWTEANKILRQELNKSNQAYLRTQSGD